MLSVFESVLRGYVMAGREEEARGHKSTRARHFTLHTPPTFANVHNHVCRFCTHHNLPGSFGTNSSLQRCVFAIHPSIHFVSCIFLGEVVSVWWKLG